MQRKEKDFAYRVFLAVLTVVAVLTISAVGTVLLRMETAEQNIIMEPETEYTEENDVQTEQKININTATQEELMLLYGVGEIRAKEIIAHRTKQPFQKPEDLMKVNGIGVSVYANLADRICVE